MLEIDNGDINQRLMESIEWIGKHSQYIRKATADGLLMLLNELRLKRTAIRS
jgi:hypothetical protein